MIELRNITKRFGGVLANDHINIAVEPGTIHAIVGENGAGKSTAMRIAYGFYTADSGEILVDGEVRGIRRPADAIALGIGMVHQHFMLVDTMTVAENIVLGAETGAGAGSKDPAYVRSAGPALWTRLDMDEARARVRKLSAELGLSVDPDALIENLSVGQQQRVELLKALYRNARLLILDEPTAVLTPLEVEEFFAILRKMREQGKTIIIITHKLAEVLSISDAVTVMRDGKVVGRVKTNQTSAAELARLMVGRDVLLHVEKAPAKPGPVVLSVRDLSVGGSGSSKKGSGGVSPESEGNPSRPLFRQPDSAVKNVTFDVRAGEIVGIAGVEGNGQRELIEAHCRTRESGARVGRARLRRPAARRAGRSRAPRARHRAHSRRPASPRAAAGVQPRRERHPRRSLPAARRRPGVMVNEREVKRRTADIIQRFDVRPPNPALPARALSGGNQQKLDHRPRVRAAAETAARVAADARRRYRRDRVHPSQAGRAARCVVARCCWSRQSSKKSCRCPTGCW